MEHFENIVENLFVDIAMAEGQEFPLPVEEVEDAVANFECSFVDVAFAEAGEFTVNACGPRQ